MTGWIATDAWKTGDYTALVAATYPEAVARAPDHQLGTPRPLSAGMMPFQRHSALTLFFGWGSGVQFETWGGLFGVGPLGFARFSQNPAAVTSVLAYESVALDASQLNDEFYATPFATLLSKALGPETGPDTFDREDRNHFMRSGLFDADDAAKVTTADRFAKIAPDRPADWTAIARQIAPVTGEVQRHAYVVRFCQMEACGGRRVEFATYTASIAHKTYEITATREIIGSLLCRAPVHPVIGRPLELGATRHQAPLIHRTDWCK
jgi:hypothetical protein